MLCQYQRYDDKLSQYTIVLIYCPALPLVEMCLKSLHVTGMFLACNMQGFGTFAMHVCMLRACNMHTTCRDLCFQCMLHVTCIQHYTHNTVTCMFLKHA